MRILVDMNIFDPDLIPPPPQCRCIKNAVGICKKLNFLTSGSGSSGAISTRIHASLVPDKQYSGSGTVSQM
jgi:hypothetical protein